MVGYSVNGPQQGPFNSSKQNKNAKHSPEYSTPKSRSPHNNNAPTAHSSQSKRQQGGGSKTPTQNFRNQKQQSSNSPSFVKSSAKPLFQQPRLPGSSPKQIPFHVTNSPSSFSKRNRNNSASSTSSNGSYHTPPCSPTLKSFATPNSHRIIPNSPANRKSPSNFASSNAYQAPTPASLPKPPMHWTSPCQPPPVDPTAHLKLLLNVLA